MKKTLAALLALSIAAVTVVGATIYQTVIIQNTATVTNPLVLHIFLDGENITDTLTIDWGSLTTGDTYYYNLTVHNTGPVSRVVMHVNGSCPGTLTWTGNNTLLANGDSVSADLDLAVGSMVGSFEWQILLDAEEVT